MNSLENKFVEIPKNIKNRMLIPHVNNNNKTGKLKGLLSNRRISFVTISSTDGIVY